MTKRDDIRILKISMVCKYCNKKDPMKLIMSVLSDREKIWINIRLDKPKFQITSVGPFHV